MFQLLLLIGGCVLVGYGVNWQTGLGIGLVVIAALLDVYYLSKK